jgi:predicted phage baseplate assembly protein
MSKVPELAYVKFLELVGIELEPAEPAQAYLTFPVRPTHPKSTADVPRRARLATEEPDAQGPIVFETERALVAVRSRLERLQSFDGFGYRDVTGSNSDATSSFEPLGPHANRDSAFLLGFNEELPQAVLTLGIFGVGEQQRVASLECAAKSFVSAVLAWEYWDGAEWAPLAVLRDESQKLTRTGVIELQGPPSGRMRARLLGKAQDAPRFWLRARLVQPGYDAPPRLLAVRTNSVLALQVETLAFEVVGGSDGRMDQEFSLGGVPVLAGSLVLEVDEGPGFVRWQEVEDLFGSGPDDTHFTLQRSTGKLRFGDGTRGRIPVANPRRRANIRALEYRVGGGLRGNVGAGAIVVLQTSVDGIDQAGVTNLQAAGGGSDEETLAAASARAPHTLKSRDRAVTASDYEELALRLVARAKALPLSHPQFPGVEVPGVVSVLVVPAVDTAKNPAPTPSEGTLRAVCALLEERRTVTTELYVVGPRYREVTVTAELVADDDADLGVVKQAVSAAVSGYFDPLAGGEDGTGWPFGGSIFYSRLYRRLLIDGVNRIVSLTLELDRDEYAACEDVPLSPGYLLKNGEHVIEVRYA